MVFQYWSVHETKSDDGGGVDADLNLARPSTIWRQPELRFLGPVSIFPRHLASVYCSGPDSSCVAQTEGPWALVLGQQQDRPGNMHHTFSLIIHESEQREGVGFW